MEAQPLSQFVYLAQSNQGKACEALIKQALDHSGVFFFGELLDCANVQALSGTEDGKGLVELLRIFSYGTYPDYQARRAELPELSVAQQRKLKLLTIVSMATKDKLIKFVDLQEALDVANARDVEDLIIDAVYQGLIEGKMDQENRCLEIESVACRDCREEDIDFIIDTLTTWHESAHTMLTSLDGMVKYSQDSAAKDRSSREELDKVIQSTKDVLKRESEAGMTSASAGVGFKRLP